MEGSFRRRDFKWKDDILYVRGRKANCSIVIDSKYQTMWRVQTPTGLSDMVNKTRAKDAAEAIVLNLLNMEEEDVKETSSGK